MNEQPKFGTPDYAAMMRPFVREDREMKRALNMNGETEASRLSDHLQHDHGSLKLCDPIVGPRIQSLAILIAVELAKQGNELDNLGDGESVALMGKCPIINVVQLAANINDYRDAEVATLQSRIDGLKNELKNAHYCNGR